MSTDLAKIAISAVIPTHNPRKDYFQRVLEALRHQNFSRSRWELLVVDNASRKNLEESLQLEWHPNARVVREERLGLTFARLRAIAEAKGELLVWIDDDNLLRSDYLAEAVKAFDKHPLLAAAGGKSLPEYEIEPPEWFELGTVPLGVRDLGDQELFVRWAPHQPRYYPESAPIGAGMVTRLKPLAAWARKIQSDPRRLKFGRTGSTLTSGEDNDMNLELLASGWELAYLPQLSLKHLIPKERLSLSYCAKISRISFRDFVAVLDKHGIRPWPEIAKWTVPLRAARAWCRIKPWKGSREQLRFENAMGQFLGRADISKSDK